jgi:hypothetical protein
MRDWANVGVGVPTQSGCEGWRWRGVGVGGEGRWWMMLEMLLRLMLLLLGSDPANSGVGLSSTCGTGHLHGGSLRLEGGGGLVLLGLELLLPADAPARTGVTRLLSKSPLEPGNPCGGAADSAYSTWIGAEMTPLHSGGFQASRADSPRRFECVRQNATTPPLLESAVLHSFVEPHSLPPNQHSQMSSQVIHFPHAPDLFTHFTAPEAVGPPRPALGPQLVPQPRRPALQDRQPRPDPPL